MRTALQWVTLLLAGLTVPSFLVTISLFAKGDWNLGKRLLATTAVLGFLLAVAFWGMKLMG